MTRRLGPPLYDEHRLDWWDQAACLGMGPDLFFPALGESAAAAKAVCARCEVRAECLEDALTMPFHLGRQGVRGGLAERERRNMRTARRLAS